MKYDDAIQDILFSEPELIKAYDVTVKTVKGTVEISVSHIELFGFVGSTMLNHIVDVLKRYNLYFYLKPDGKKIIFRIHGKKK